MTEKHKIRVKVIAFLFKEGERGNECPLAFLQLADADAQIRQWAARAPDDGAYDKLDYVVVFADGQTYMGRFDIQRRHVMLADLAKEMRDYLEFCAGRRRPPHWSEEEYGRFLEDQGERQKAQAVEFLHQYDI